MANRVLVYPGGIKVSKPGFDVLTATEQQLLLHMDAKRAQIIKMGVATLANPVVPLSGMGGTPPLVTHYYFIPDSMWDYDGNSWDVYHTPWPVPPVGDVSTAVVTASQITFTISNANMSGRVRYVVFREAAG